MGHATGGVRALRDVLRSIADELPAHQRSLDELDAMLGDGDHGLTMLRCCRAVGARLDVLPDGPVADALEAVGMGVVAGVGGASGALFGEAFVAAGQAVRDREPAGPRRPDAARVAAMLEAAQRAIASRGRVGPGDKTMLDAILPAAAAAGHVASSGGSVVEAVEAAAAAAEQGAAATAEMVGRAGRASRLGERSLGHRDPGAVSVAIMLRIAADRLRTAGER
jgi:dihydroxyacetone kinase-like protein